MYLKDSYPQANLQKDWQNYFKSHEALVWS